MTDNSSIFRKVLFISHDGNRAGAQLFLLQVVRYFQSKGHECHVLFLGDGSLITEFKLYAKTYLWQEKRPTSSLLSRLKQPKELEQSRLENIGFDWIYVNTIAASPVVSWLITWNKAPIVSHIHELAFSISMYSTAENRTKLFEHSDCIIACSNAVQENLVSSYENTQNKVITIHSFVDNERVLQRVEGTDRKKVREKIGVSNDAFCVVSCGNAEWRKGIDLFLKVAAQHKKDASKPPILFVWVGMPQEGTLWNQVTYDTKRMGLEENCLFIPPTPDAVELIAAMDIFLLPSREDPFPLVMLEAALAVKPIIGFEKTGGCAEFVGEDAGFLVPYGDVQGMYQRILGIFQTPKMGQSVAEKAKEKVCTVYTFDKSMQKIEQLMLEMTQL